MKTITFEYNDKFDDDSNCQLPVDKKQGTHFGCCCTCRHRARVYDHFLMPSEKDLGFFVCTAFVDMEKDSSVNYRADLIEKHGVCELHQNRIKK